MSTKILVPRASGEGGIGSSDKAWDNGYFNTGHFNEDIYISGVPIAFALEEAGVGGKWEDSATAGDIYYDGGKVAVGTQSPTYPLESYGKGNNTIAITSHADTTLIKHCSLETDANGFGKLQVNNDVGNVLCLVNSNGDSYFNGGNVGIGTASPQAKLSVGTSAAPTEALSSAIFQYGAEIESSGDAWLTLKSTEAQDGIAWTISNNTSTVGGVKKQGYFSIGHASQVLCITQQSKVGIRTEVPQDQLEIWTNDTDCALSIYNEADADKKFDASVYGDGGVLTLLDGGIAVIQIDGRVGTPNFSWFNGGKVAIGKDFAGVTDSPAVPRLEVNATQGSPHTALYVNAQAAYQATFNSTDGRFCQVNWTSDVLNDRPNSNFRNGYIALDLGLNGDLSQQYFVIGVADNWINNADNWGVYNGIAIRCASSGTNSFVFAPGAAGSDGLFECLGNIQMLSNSAIEMLNNSAIQMLSGSAIEMASGSAIEMASGSSIKFDTPNAILSAASTGTGPGTLYIGTQSITTSSDIRIKKNIEDSKVNALDILGKIRIVDFEWDDPTDTSFNNRNARGRWTGFIAQEAIEHFPTLINAPRKEEDLSIDTESELTWGVDQAAAIPMLIKAVQEQQSIIEELKAEIQALKSN